MRPTAPPTRPPLRALSLLPGLLLVLGLVTAALHHHPDESHAHPCAICTLSHAPAVATVAETPAPPAFPIERLAPPTLHAPRAVARVPADARAPPPA